MTLFQNLCELLDSFAFFVLQNYRNYLVVLHRLTAELVSRGPLGFMANQESNHVILEGHEESGRVR